MQSKARRRKLVETTFGLSHSCVFYSWVFLLVLVVLAKGRIHLYIIRMQFLTDIENCHQVIFRFKLDFQVWLCFFKINLCLRILWGCWSAFEVEASRTKGLEQKCKFAFLVNILKNMWIQPQVEHRLLEKHKVSLSSKFVPTKNGDRMHISWCILPWVAVQRGCCAWGCERPRPPLPTGILTVFSSTNPFHIS